jgi:hypothetical protein
MPPTEDLPIGEQPHRPQSRRVRKIDFTELDRLGTRADQAPRGSARVVVLYNRYSALGR